MISRMDTEEERKRSVYSIQKGLLEKGVTGCSELITFVQRFLY